MRSVDWPLTVSERKTPMSKVTSIATQTSPRARQPRNRFKPKNQSKLDGRLVDKLTTISNNNEGKTFPSDDKSKPVTIKSNKDKNQQKLSTKSNDNQIKRNQTNPLTEKWINKQQQSTKSSSSSSNTTTGKSSANHEPVVFVPVDVNDQKSLSDNQRQSTNNKASKLEDELKTINSKSKLNSINNAKVKSTIKDQQLVDYSNLDDEERVRLFSEMIKDKVKLKVENRRKEKSAKNSGSVTKRTGNRARVSSAFSHVENGDIGTVDDLTARGLRTGSSMVSLEDIINHEHDETDTDRLSVLEKIAHDDNYIETIKTPNGQTINSDDNLFKGINVPDKNFQLSWV